MPTSIPSQRDPSLQATVVRRVPLRYTEGPDVFLDRPDHIRAGSGLVRLGERIAIIQDDALFVALLDPASGDIAHVTLPAGEGGLRLFDEHRGNKHFKPDLEACTAVPWTDGEALLAFGSGSTGRRETLVLLTVSGQVRMIEAPGLYAALRAETVFSGSELNVEGALYADGRLWLFNRGNGAPRDGLGPVNAICELDWSEVAPYLAAPEKTSVPRPQAVRQYALGTLNGGMLGFTDASLTPFGLLYSASAEASPDAVRDGDVTGSAIGILPASSGPRWIELRLTDGALFPHKVEGLCPADQAGHLYLIVDADDHTRPAELCEVVLSGSW